MANDEVQATATKNINVTLRLTHQAGGFKDDASMLEWIHACLNCNTNNIKAEVVDLVELDGSGESVELAPRG